MGFELGEYKGHSTLSIWQGEERPKWTFTFGIEKAKSILENINAVEEFVAQNSGGEN